MLLCVENISHQRITMTRKHGMMSMLILVYLSYAMFKEHSKLVLTCVTVQIIPSWEECVVLSVPPYVVCISEIGQYWRQAGGKFMVVVVIK